MAQVSAIKELVPWSGPGTTSVWLTYPSGGDGRQTFHYVNRYAQGILFSCTRQGHTQCTTHT